FSQIVDVGEAVFSASCQAGLGLEITGGRPVSPERITAAQRRGFTMSWNAPENIDGHEVTPSVSARSGCAALIVDAAAQGRQHVFAYAVGLFEVRDGGQHEAVNSHSGIGCELVDHLLVAAYQRSSRAGAVGSESLPQDFRRIVFAGTSA